MATFKSKKELVYEHLREEILNSNFPPGKRLVIDSLASELGVSQIPIREALQQLQAEGFVTFEAHVGPSVATIEPDEIWEIFQLLEALEVVSCRAACRRMSDENIHAMDAMVEDMDGLTENPEEWSQANQRFHQALCEWGQTKMVKNLMFNVLAQWNRLRHHYLKDVFLKRLDLSQQDHRDLVDALHARDAESAERVVRRHNQRALSDYVTYLESIGHSSDNKEKKNTT